VRDIIACGGQCPVAGRSARGAWRLAGTLPIFRTSPKVALRAARALPIDLANTLLLTGHCVPFRSKPRSSAAVEDPTRRVGKRGRSRKEFRPVVQFGIFRRVVAAADLLGLAVATVRAALPVAGRIFPSGETSLRTGAIRVGSANASRRATRTNPVPIDGRLARVACSAIAVGLTLPAGIGRACAHAPGFGRTISVPSALLAVVLHASSS